MRGDTLLPAKLLSELVHEARWRENVASYNDRPALARQYRATAEQLDAARTSLVLDGDADEAWAFVDAGRLQITRLKKREGIEP